jgi:hypothetical protein
MKRTSLLLVAALGCGGTSVSPPIDAAVGDAAAGPLDPSRPESDAGTAADASMDARESDASNDTGASPPSESGTSSDAGTPADASPQGDASVACPRYAPAARTGFVAHSAVTEASGVVNSRRNADALWVHNDSGGQAQVFAITRAGGALATYTLEGARAVDWEDIAIGPGPQQGEPYLYIADIGDNGRSRSSVTIYRVLEPTPPSAASVIAPTSSLTGVESLVFRYPDGAHNAETLLVDPLSGDIFIVEKASDGDSQIFRAAAPHVPGSTRVMDSVGRLRFGAGALAGSVTTTGGDISPNGRSIAIRTYDRAFLWRRAPGQSVASALTGEPCAIPLATEGQGEALGFASDERGYFTLSEGRFVPISYYAIQ